MRLQRGRHNWYESKDDRGALKKWIGYNIKGAPNTQDNREDRESEGEEGKNEIKRNTSMNYKKEVKERKKNTAMRNPEGQEIKYTRKKASKDTKKKR